MGSFVFSSQYQQQPLPPDGSIVEWDWFCRYGIAPQHGHIVQSWDMASKDTEFSDFSVCTTWMVQRDEYFLFDLFRAKLIFPALRKAVIDRAERWKPVEILIEDAAAGIHIIQELTFDRPASMPRPIAVRAEKDKVTRLHAVTAVIEQKRVYLPQYANWMDDLRTEIIQFPHGRYDDQVDSISQFLGRYERRRLDPPRAVSISMFGRMSGS
jgi:predicted phage terminase large subunit-like protein